MGLAIALGLRRLRAWYRVAWHKLTGRWPRYKWRPMDRGRPCTSGEMKAALRLIRSWSKGAAAPEAEYQKSSGEGRAEGNTHGQR